MAGHRVVLRGAIGTRLQDNTTRPELGEITADGATYDEALAALQAQVSERDLLLHVLLTDG